MAAPDSYHLFQALNETVFTPDKEWDAEKGRWVDITSPDEDPAIKELVKNWEMTLTSDCPELPVEVILEATRKTFEDAVVEIRKEGWESAPIHMIEEELGKKTYVTHLVPWKVSKSSFDLYVSFQRLGGFNMLELPKRYPSQFSREDMIMIMQHYSLYMERYSNQ